MGFVSFILTIVGLAAFVVTITGCVANGDPARRTTGLDVAVIIFFAFVTIVSFFGAGYCVG